MIRRLDGTERVPPFVRVSGVWYLVMTWNESHEDSPRSDPDLLVLRALRDPEEKLLREKLHDAYVEAHAFIGPKKS